MMKFIHGIGDRNYYIPHTHIKHTNIHKYKYCDHFRNIFNCFS